MTTKKPTAKQLAARAKFAAMARSGALAKRGKVKAKPARKTPSAMPSRRTNPVKRSIPKHPTHRTFAYVVEDNKGRPVFGANSEKLALQVAQNLADNTGKQHALIKNYGA